MAGMDPYTAYEDEGPSAGGMAVDVATSAFKPSTYLWTYSHMPSMWSGAKGVALPFDMAQMKRAARGVGVMARRGNIPGVVGQAGKMAFSLRPFGGGTRVMAAGDKLEKLNFAKTKAKYALERNWAEYSKMLKGQGAFEATQQGIIKNAQLAMPTGANLKVPKKRLGRHAKKSIQKAQAALATREAALSNLEQRSKYLSNFLKKSVSVKTGLKFAKWGFRAAKAAAIVGAVGFAWDVTQMIAQPVGRAIVGELDTALSSWNDRFMPELGGQLEMTYLSRGAATDRQRAINAMSKAQITGRSAFGQEAKYAHG